ncbi:MAG: hypothetical protein IJ438_02100 [Clostridia bacterium]|nr:hypothetical protein [Clostridia bacterium]
MKKVLCVISILTIILTSVLPAIAEEKFSLYNGLQFGMTMNQAMGKLGYSSRNKRDADNLGRPYLSGYVWNFLDIDSVDIAVHFDENGLSKTVVYELGSYYDRYEIDYQQYNRIEALLKGKYGYTEYNNTTAKRLPFKEAEFMTKYPYGTDHNVYAMTSLNGQDAYNHSGTYYYHKLSCPQFSQWVVPVSDGYVVVEHSLWCHEAWVTSARGDKTPDFYELINYAFLTETEYDTLIKDKPLDVYNGI